jgi:hypothetical protein
MTPEEIQDIEDIMYDNDDEIKDLRRELQIYLLEKTKENKYKHTSDNKVKRQPYKYI